MDTAVRLPTESTRAGDACSDRIEEHGFRKVKRMLVSRFRFQDTISLFSELIIRVHAKRYKQAHHDSRYFVIFEQIKYSRTAAKIISQSNFSRKQRVTNQEEEP